MVFRSKNVVNDSNRVFAGGGDVCSEHDDYDDWMGGRCGGGVEG